MGGNSANERAFELFDPIVFTVGRLEGEAVGVELRISVEGDDGVALSSLYRWLDEDREVAAQVELTKAGEAEPGTQSAAFDAIVAVVNSAVGMASLAVSYATWRDAHRRKEVVTFEGDGRAVRAVDASDVTTRKIIEAFPEPQQSSESEQELEA